MKNAFTFPSLQFYNLSRAFSFSMTVHTLFRLLFIMLIAVNFTNSIFAKPANAYLSFALPGTALSESSIRANWSQPAGVNIHKFILDLSTSSTFATFVNGYQAKDVINFSIDIGGLQPSTTYYYRLRYVAVGETTESAYSNVISVSTSMSNFLSNATFRDTDLASLPIFPVFNKNVTSYTLDTDVNTLTVTPIALDSYSTISCRINSGAQTVITNVITSVSFNLNQGTNSIELKVSSPDMAFKIYNIEVHVIAPTIVTSINPAKAAPGSSIIITGSRFNANPSQNVVFFGTAKGTVTAASATSLTVTVPNGASNSPVTVVNKETASMGYSKNFFFPTARTFKPAFVSSDFSARLDVSIPSSTFQKGDIMDVNNDTKPDIIWPRGNDKTSVLLNNSTLGGLLFPTTPDDFDHKSQGRIKAGDINGDGRPDVIASTDRSFLFNTTVSNYLSFETHDSERSDALSSELIQDIDGDGKPDVVATGNSNAVIRRNMTVGNIAAFGPPIEFNPDANVYAIGDIDGDGKPDLVVVNGNNVGVMRNTSKIGRISFDSKTTFATANVSNIALGDLDGDGKLDMAGISGSGKKIITFRNTTINGVVSFDVMDFATSTDPGAIAIGDINGDGKPDLAVTLYANSAEGHKVLAILNESVTGSISFGTSLEMFTAPSPGTQVYITDMDRNGRPDLSVVNFYERTISIFSYKPPLSNNASLSALSISSGDLYSTFTSADTTYNTILDAVTTSFSVTATAAHEKQILMIRINGGEHTMMASGAPSSLTLLPGTNKIEVKLTAGDGVTTRTYTINIFAPFAPPGKALKFAGTNEYIETRNSTDSPNFTLEVWIRTSTTSPTGSYAYQGSTLFGADQGGEANDFVMSVLNNKIAFHDGNASATTIGKTTITDGRWHHVAVVREENVSVKIYIDGILDQTGSAGFGQLRAVAAMTLGGIPGYTPASFTGSMDEVRVWKSARTGAEIKQSYLTVIDPTHDDLQAYFNFDIGSQENNPIMTNMKGVFYGKAYLYNLDPSGSNWEESYAMVVPVAKNASNSTSTGFTANWSAPAYSTATKYFLDVATSATFASEFLLPGYNNLEVSGTSKVVTIPGMGSGRQMADATYYYRVRAEKSSEIGQGTNSTTITVAYNPLPVNLIAFTGKKMENANLLEWKVTGETEFDRYEVERSSDTKNFARIGIVTAKSNEKSGVTNYEYADQTFQSAHFKTISYYRLKMLDLDGSFAYSRIASVIQERPAKIIVYPNPAGDFISIDLESNMLNSIASLYDQGGRLLKTVRITKSQQQINIKPLPGGLYTITFADGSAERFVKD